MRIFSAVRVLVPPASLFFMFFLLLLVSCESEAEKTINDTVINIINDNGSINISPSINLSEIKQECYTQYTCLPNPKCDHRRKYSCDGDGIVCIPEEKYRLETVCFSLTPIYDSVKNETSSNETCIKKYISYESKRCFTVTDCATFERCDEPMVLCRNETHCINKSS